MQFCKLCIMPSTRPEQVFDTDGVCDACNSARKKHQEINWDSRRKKFEDILARYRGDGSQYDCLIPVSGGKDSCYQYRSLKQSRHYSRNL